MAATVYTFLPSRKFSIFKTGFAEVVPAFSRKGDVTVVFAAGLQTVTVRSVVLRGHVGAAQELGMRQAKPNSTIKCGRTESV